MLSGSTGAGKSVSVFVCFDVVRGHGIVKLGVMSTLCSGAGMNTLDFSAGIVTLCSDAGNSVTSSDLVLFISVLVVLYMSANCLSVVVSV